MTLPQSSAVQSLSLLQNISLSLMFTWREVASLLPFLTPGHPPKLFASLYVQMHSQLPAAIPEHALYWWCPDRGEGDGPGACWTFLGALKPPSQQLNRSPRSSWWYDKWLYLNQSYWQQYPCLVKPFFVQSNDDGMCILAGNHVWQRKNNDSKHHPPFEASSLLFKLNQHARVISSLVLIDTHTCVNERITDMMSSGPFVAGLKCSGNVSFGDSVHLHGKEGLIAIHLITLHNMLEYMQFAIIQTEAADFVEINICVILNFWPWL